jgi:nucleoside-diphosphate-sugar epimerase
MRVFVTGATGFIGSAITSKLLNAGHQVIGLTRSVEGAEMLRKYGAEPLLGGMEDFDILRRGADATDAVIHSAFNHDFTKFLENCETDRLAIEALGDALADTDKPLIVTSGLPLTPNDQVSEEYNVLLGAGGSPRVSEQTAMTLLERNVRVSVVRMSQAHDINKQGLATFMIALAREKKVSAYISDGLNRWPAVHRLDAASLYQLALEKGQAGAKYHAVSEKGVSVKSIAQTIGQRLNIPAISLSVQEAKDHFGWLANPVGMDSPASSALTKQRLGWLPKEPSEFLDNLKETNAYYI